MLHHALGQPEGGAGVDARRLVTPAHTVGKWRT